MVVMTKSYILPKPWIFTTVKICDLLGNMYVNSPIQAFSRVLFLLSPSFLYLKIKDGGYNNTTINKQLSSTQNTPAVQAYHKYKGNKLEKPDKHGEK